eukprot:617568-Karenia_brevis.AAC.1
MAPLKSWTRRAKYGSQTLHRGWACSGQLLKRPELVNCGSQPPNIDKLRAWSMALTYQCHKGIIIGTSSRAEWPRLGH